MIDISIITPSLNSAGVISDCVRSVLEQNQTAEQLVVDGRSLDDTISKIREITNKLQVISEVPAGIYSAINSGITAATGEVIGILNADDFYANPEVLRKVAAVFEDQSVDACYGDLCYVDAEDTSRIVRYWRSGDYDPRRFFSGWMPPHPTFFVRRRIYEKYGLYRTDLGTAADYELMLRFMVKHGISTDYIPEVLVKMRIGGASNASWRARIAANRMDRKSWELNGLKPYPWTLLAKPLRKIGQWWGRPR